MKPFNLEAFKAGQKACLIEGKWFRYGFTTSEGRICVEYEAALPLCDKVQVYHLETLKKAHMVSRHQALIDSYDPEDTWQVHTKQSGTWVTIKEPTWDEDYEWRLHPHNDLIKAYKKGAKIECKHKDKEWRDASSDDIRSWYEDAEYRIKPELEFTYPIYKQSKYSGVVVEFTNLETGKVLVGNNFYESDQVQITGIPHTDAAQWQDWTPLTKSKLTTHCLAYDASLDPNPKLWGPPVVSEKQFAVKKGWHIIQEWEV